MFLLLIGFAGVHGAVFVLGRGVDAVEFEVVRARIDDVVRSARRDDDGRAVADVVLVGCVENDFSVARSILFTYPFFMGLV